ncbi:MAG TPA: class I SAM-dependent methyltransferase [Ktedonobacterales bacterium]
MTGYDPRFPPFGTSSSNDASDWDDWDPDRARRGYTQQVPAVPRLPLPPDTGLDLPGVVTPHRSGSGPNALGPAALALSARAEKEDYLTVTYNFHEPGFVELYDALFVPQWSTPFGRLLLSVFLTLPRDTGWQLLDVGCGTGYPALELARFLGQDCDLAGIDTWEEAILLARHKASEEWLRNVNFLAEDICETALPEGSFDTITCNLALSSFEDPRAALGAMWRLMRAGGQLILTTPLQSAMREFLDTYHLTLRDLKLQDYMRTLGAQVAARPTINTVQRLIESSGFVIRRTVTDSFALRFPDSHAFLTSPLVQTLYLGAWRDIIPDMTIRRLVFNEVERRLKVRAQANGGELVMHVPMLCISAERP